MCKSLLKELRFKIGEQYDLNEFNLKSLESTFTNGLEYENYEYIKGDFKTLFGLEFSSNIILQYNADILLGIIYEFKLTDLKVLVEKIGSYLPIDIEFNEENPVLGKTFSLFQNQEILLMLDIQGAVQLKVCKFQG